MSSEKLKLMLANAENEKARRDEEARARDTKHVADMEQAAAELRQRVLPRLKEARAVWAESGADLQINDRTSQNYNDRHSIDQKVPEIAVSLSGSSFIFRSHSHGYAHVAHGSGRNKGNQAYSFQVNTIEDLSDDMIDQVLETLVRRANGLERDE